MQALRVTERAGEWLFGPMDEGCAREIAQWRYPLPYSFYNCPDERVEDEVRCLLNPENRYWAIWDREGELVGYAGVGDDCRVSGGAYAADALDVGGGLRPDRTGRGLGAAFWGSALELIDRHYAPGALRVTVAAFNRRALWVWERLGFCRVEAFEATGSGVPFVVLLRESSHRG